VTHAAAAIRRAAATAVRYKPLQWPSQWIARQVWISGAILGTGTDAHFDIWHYPANVGIVDAAREARRGIYVQKAVQMGVSHYLQALIGWEITFHGGPVAYSMAKDDTVREHVLDRVESILAHSSDLRELYLPGREHHETILSKRFTNATLKFFGARAVTNFKSNPYRAFFCDEFELMDVAPDGSDRVSLAMGRQAAFPFPRLYGWSSPLETEAGITKYIELDSDCRRFFVRCPHCAEAIWFDFERDVHFAHHPNSTRPIAESAELRCYRCGHAITDAERARALVRAAKAACPWFADVPYDDEIGWVTTLAPEEAVRREFAGFMDLNHLYNPRKTVREIALQYCAIRTEAQKKTFSNDVLGRGYTIIAQQLTEDDVRARVAAKNRSHVPAGTLYVTCGIDVQGGGELGDLMFYFDVSAWVHTGEVVRKVTLEVSRIKGTKRTRYIELQKFLRSWKGADPSGGEYPISTVCIDAGWRTKEIYALCNCMCGGQKAQWVRPVIYSSEKIGGARIRTEPQNAEVGDPARVVVYTSHDYLTGRAIQRLQVEGLCELPAGLPAEVARHYLAVVEVEEYDRHNNYRGSHYVKKQLAKGQKEDDDWLQAAAYCELAAIIRGLDEVDVEQVREARRQADSFARRRDANRDEWRKGRLERSHRVWHKHGHTRR